METNKENKKEKAMDKKSVTENPSNHKSKVGLIILAAVMALGVTYAVIGMHEANKEIAEESNVLREQLEYRDSVYNDIVDLMFGVESQIQQIKERENLMTSPGAGDFDRDRPEQMITDLRSIDSLIFSTNNKVADLTSRLTTTEMNLSSFKKRVAQLTNELNERKESLTALRNELKLKDGQIAQFQYDIQNMEEVHERQLEFIQTQVDAMIQRENEMNTAYVAIGSDKDLESKAIIKKEGGFLGLGKNTVLKGNAEKSEFIEVDIRLTDMLELDAKKVDLITSHPANSYQLKIEDDKVKFLEITNPEQFWKLSKYLVIEVKS